MPRHTHGQARERRHSRAQVREQAQRWRRRRFKDAAREIDCTLWSQLHERADGSEIVIFGDHRLVRAEEYLPLSREQVSGRWDRWSLYSKDAWLRVHRLDQSRGTWRNHECWWGPGLCGWCAPPRSRVARQVRREILAEIDEWRLGLDIQGAPPGSEIHPRPS